ncbi:winged helix-turn-helix transcriptional regulator [Micromonospora cathayae]|uniref:Helix-turn-helix domain-containing protein n=1 Tax=Micromonospora cathayae TaxID=3028804 RepID=A0ABY7ZNT3_9ACTN|nr:helix-turn-helix domain-containing protein [Micromonospora sp. HUAS 3]WDZ84610.1 helix-turn-helix domain-containing protein [Micromonospora sp. HUAS 3]
MADPLPPDLFHPDCPGVAVPLQVGDRWTGMVVRCLAFGPRRFTELRAALRGVTAKVLAETLRAMRRDGLVTRTAYPENPPRVEYALTPLGRTLIDLLDAARRWTDDHLAEVLAARRAHLDD